MKFSRLLVFSLCVLPLAAMAAQASVTISNAPTKNMTCAGAICTPSRKNANLNTGQLQTMLGSSNVTVKTGAGAISIGVNDPLAWGSTHRLTLDAIQSVNIKAAVVVEGKAALTLTTNDGGTGGGLLFENGSSITFWDLSSDLASDGQHYVLIGDIKTLARRIQANPSGHYALARNYDASLDGTYHSAPIATKFLGTFEGLGNTISNLAIHPGHNADVGLFTDSAGTLRDLALTNLNISFGRHAGGSAGALAAANDSTGTILHVTASGLSITAHGPAAGLVVRNDGAIFGAAVSGTIFAPSGGDAAGIATVNNGTISQATASVTVTAYAGGAGGLVETNNGTISQSNVSGTIGGYSAAKGGGGLVDINTGTIEQSRANANATGEPSAGLAVVNSGIIDASRASGSAGGYFTAGGLVAFNTGTITGSDASTSVNVLEIGGGLVGRNEAEAGGLAGSIVRCHATGGVVARVAGGLVGKNETFRTLGRAGNRALISRSYATGPAAQGSAFGGVEVGGLVGENAQSNIEDSYATGQVSASNGFNSDAVGGLVGVNSSGGRIVRGYATGLISPVGDAKPGGFIGIDKTSGDLDSDYWNSDTSGISNPHQGAGNLSDDPGITGLTDAQLKSALPAGFDPNVWGQDPNINNGWPYLLANPPQ